MPDTQRLDMRCCCSLYDVCKPLPPLPSSHKTLIANISQQLQLEVRKINQASVAQDEIRRQMRRLANRVSDHLPRPPPPPLIFSASDRTRRDQVRFLAPRGNPKWLHSSSSSSFCFHHQLLPPPPLVVICAAGGRTCFSSSSESEGDALDRVDEVQDNESAELERRRKEGRVGLAARRREGGRREEEEAASDMNGFQNAILLAVEHNGKQRQLKDLMEEDEEEEDEEERGCA
eukprot:551634-Hanusia_phi.AAC.1